MRNIKLNLQKGRLDQALKELIDRFKETEYGNELIILSSRNFLNQKNKRIGVISYSEFDMLENRITGDTLSLVQLLEKDLKENLEYKNRILEKKIILFCEANPFPDKNLFSNVEVREIIEVLESKESKLDLQIKFGLSLEKFINSITQHKPQIIHFTSYSDNGGIYFHDKLDKPNYVTNSLFKNYIEMTEEKIECIFFNTFVSEELAKEISTGKIVIGFNGVIDIFGAIEFATGFYTALEFGKDYITAFEIGYQTLLSGTFKKNTAKLYAYSNKELHLINENHA